MSTTTKTRISSPDVAVTAVRTLQLQGWTLPEAVAGVIMNLDTASIDMVIDAYGDVASHARDLQVAREHFGTEIPAWY